MIAERLRQAVLHAAISGYLTKQHVADGNAIEIINGLKDRRKSLEREGVLKKRKPLPIITEPPSGYELPQNWVLVRFGDLFTRMGAGSTPLGGAKVYTPDGIMFLRSQNVYNDGLRLDGVARISQETHEKMANTKVEGGDILLNITGASIGRSAIVPSLGWETANVNQHVSILRPLDDEITSYLHLMITSPYFQGLIAESSPGASRDGLAIKRMELFPVPIPPLAEQKRILQRVNQILPLIDHLAELEREREHLDAEFGPALERAILQAALSGQLSIQLPEDGNAPALIKEITAERAQLVKEGKLKKQKQLPPVTETEWLFDIPVNWAWARLGDIFSMQAGKNVPTGTIQPNGMYACYGGNGIRGFVPSYNREGTFPIIGRQGALCGNINVATGKFFATEHAVVVESFAGCSKTWIAKTLTALNLNQYATSTAQPGISVEKIAKTLIPVPPLAEQERIAEKLDNLLPLVESIKGS